ncbi:hypothetical protein BOX15_Mlig029228g2 [Macrostomum lignano]|uniref:Membrane-bound transcription factor site-1 protease n=1 Tax=Macrostomum lignano TaxID=282301 RepID=A0A267E4D1_9PLAT|nr:hypothetical protein BOX15_Mlig029228g2 [Macrostomum lignano]
MRLTLCSLLCVAMATGIYACGGNQTDSELRYEFSTETVPREYIVRYAGYHGNEARACLLSGALAGLPCAWRAVRRDNPAAQHPSDFDLLRLAFNCTPALTAEATRRLLASDAVRSVTPQRRVTRTLHGFGPADEDVELPRWHSRRSFSHAPIVSGGLGAGVRPAPTQITSALQADVLWSVGFSGRGVRVSVFDTGLAAGHGHFKRGRVKERSNWTNEKTLDDGLGHGTFVAGVIASYRDCLGFAPDADLYIFRVFTNAQVSYTSWFLDAFNYAMLRRIHVINLSIGGPDFLDRPFVDKVWELTSNGVVLVSAIGNDGPLYGTLNNPADQMDVVGVGGIDFDDRVARFSSRGMTTWELPDGYGRLKPDIVTYGAGMRGSGLRETCRALSGTSVASPVVAGAVALLYSAVLHRGPVINPASIKQALLASARRLPDANMFEQGHGKLDLLRAYQLLRAYKPQASLSPSYIDFTDCPYMWPYCSQPMYFTGLPVVVNVTILNGMSVAGRIRGEPLWIDGQNGRLLTVSATHSELLWPWSGWLALQLGVAEAGADFDGVAEGWLNFTVETVGAGVGEETSTELSLPVRVRIAPRPPRSRRLLWDQFHSLRYPSGYFPRDNLRVKLDPLDWHGDHPHTNFRDLYGRLRSAGYFVEVAGRPLTCYNASNYGALLLVDTEEEFFPEEVAKLGRDVAAGLSVLVLADWYNTSVMRRVRFFDENTRQWWVPDTGGANVPALNDLLGQFGVALGDRVLDGEFRLGDRLVAFSSGCDIAKFPDDGRVLTAALADEGHQLMQAGGAKSRLEVRAPVLGFAHAGSQPVRPGTGRIAVLGDSNCADSAHQLADCYWLVAAMLHFATAARLPAFADGFQTWKSAGVPPSPLPMRMEGSRLRLHSRVLLPSAPDQIDAASPRRRHRPLPACPTPSPCRRVAAEAAGDSKRPAFRAASLALLPEDRVPLPPDRLSAESLESAIRNRQQTAAAPIDRAFRLFALSCTLLAAAGLLAFAASRCRRRLSRRARPGLAPGALVRSASAGIDQPLLFSGAARAGLQKGSGIF